MENILLQKLKEYIVFNNPELIANSRPEFSLAELLTDKLNNIKPLISDLKANEQRNISALNNCVLKNLKQI